MEVTKLSDIEFKIMFIKMLKELTDNYKELNENYNSMKKEIETIHKNQEEMNSKISEIKNPYVDRFVELRILKQKEHTTRGNENNLHVKEDVSDCS